jgi:glycyl-tRNA synthetase beta chain
MVEGRGEYLLEVRTEEIPARMLEPGIRRLATRVFEDLMGRGLGPSEVETGYSPRRLVLVLRGLPAGEPDREEQVVGPPARVAWDAEGRPTKALEGFARRLGLEPEALERVATDKGEYAGARQLVRGRSTAEVLAEIVPSVLLEIPWAKTMRWGAGLGPWVRPVHGIVSLLDGRVVPFELFGVQAGDRTAGHPVLSPEEFAVTGAAGYREALGKRGIVIDPRLRKSRLAEGMAARARSAGGAAGGSLVEDPELLAKLAAMCEIPGVMEGRFPESFLALPREVLITSLRDHQSAFTVEAAGATVAAADTDAGLLLPRFLTVMDRPDDPAGRVRAGNEWVVEARLADARFFYAEDRKRPLAERQDALEHLGFHARLGSYAAKAERLVVLSRWICDRLGWPEEASDAERAARLLKVDLVTEMVKEFTSLQGVIGGIYAREDGESEAVWQAIYDQYRPASTDDPVPRGRVGAATALADRFDTLVGMFGLGQIPKGSRDPFGLRRAAQGAVRICLECGDGGVPLDLAELARAAAGGYGGTLERTSEEILADLSPFLDDRVRHLLGLCGYAYDEIEAGLAAQGVHGLPDLAARVDALHRVRDEPAFLSVVLAAKRIANILKEPPPDGYGEPDPALFEADAEGELHRAGQELAEDVEEAAERGDYEGALRRIADLAEVLDGFFVDVLVMADDEAVRANRLALLHGTGRTLSRVAGLTEMVVDREEHRRRHMDIPEDSTDD